MDVNPPNRIASQPPSGRSEMAYGLKCWLACVCALSFVWHLPAQTEPPNPSQTTSVVAIQGTNWWIAPAGARDFVQASLNVPQPLRSGDRLRTGPETKLFIRTPNLGVVQVPPRSTIEISQPSARKNSVIFRLWEGVLYFFHRGSPEDLEVHSNTASAAIRGTEFVAETLPDGGLIIRVLDGRVVLSNDQGNVYLQTGEQGVAATGALPERAVPLPAAQAIQWFLYYPAVVHSEEIPWTNTQRDTLEESLRAYRQGDLLAALHSIPETLERAPATDLYRAALWLAVGKIDQSLALLERIPSETSGASIQELKHALTLLIDVVHGQTSPDNLPLTRTDSPSLSLARSYAWQARSDLRSARHAARRATALAPEFGFAWARLAELEFSHGRTDAALSALDRAMAIAPRHAPAVALQGFLHAAKMNHSEARMRFNQAIGLDPGYGDAWLGRGLVRMHEGDGDGGLKDLEMAAAVEPQRSLLRSYLAKAWADQGNLTLAEKELDLAQSLDPRDPTPWLYQALIDQQQNRINAGIEHLEKSKALNDHRSVYRSRMLLDQDQAVRSANLASLYRDAGMIDVARREASEAVATDYANASAHWFLASAYHELRDPNQIDLRYETPWFTEYLLANLLSPVGFATLSPLVSQQEYSRLFDRRQWGLASLTEYSSNGDWTQSGAHYGQVAKTAYAVEGDYRSLNGRRRNQDLEQTTLSLKVKQQLTLQDNVFFQAVYYDAEGGDLARVYDPSNPAYVRSQFRFEENQEPLLLGGYHRQWRPGQHTLFLAARLQDTLSSKDAAQPVLIVGRDLTDAVTGTVLTSLEQSYRSELEIYSAELQHIADLHPVTFIAGTRYQFGDFETRNRQENLADLNAALPNPLQQHIRPGMNRLSAYTYAQWQAADPLILFGGLTYDRLRYPANHRFAPLTDDETTEHALLPKAGLQWRPWHHATLRAAYRRSLGGVSLEQSTRLEPSQIAGFNQAWRSLIPESEVGSQAGARMEMGSVEWDQRFPTDTYLSLRGDWGQSKLHRQVGIFDLPFLAEPGATSQRLHYEEQSARITLHQRLGTAWTLGTQYRWSRAELDNRYPEIPENVPHMFDPYELQPNQNLTGTLHQWRLFAVFNHPSGWFGHAESLWSQQSNRGYDPDRPGEDFWQFNLYAGYRFAQRRAELRLGVLNLTDRDYRLNPLNLTADMPRDRTFVASLKLNW